MSKHLVRNALIALTTLATLSAVIGCGIGASDSSTDPLTVPAFAGKAIGGQMPIIGATVKLYATTSTGYGVGSLIEEATQQGASTGQDTNSGGGFSFPGPVTCPAGQFAYIVVSGGNTGANAVNPNAVLVAALGRCEDLYTSTSSGTYDGPAVYVNELTTIAAAYALGNFSSVSGTGAATVVGIGSDANNNAAQVNGVSTGCVAGVGSCTTTATAGLAHAFLNAATLVNPFANTAQIGANTTLAADTAAVVPQQLIDTIGNILVACVNSTGGTAGDGIGDACDQIFTATAIGSSVPANTFSAMVNLAANPTLSGSTTNVASFYAIAAPATNVYSPYITSTTGLHDYSVGIVYPSGLGASTSTASLATCGANPCQGLLFPTSGALDINDVYYVANSAGSGGTTPVNLFAFSSDGALLRNTTNGSATHAYGLSVDALGNGYFGNGSTSGTTALAVFTTGGGSGLSSYGTLKTVGGSLHVYSTACDQANNVWAFGTAGSNSLWMSPAGGASFTAQGTFDVSAVTSNATGLAIDSNQNVWAAGGTSISVLPNTASAGTTPTYTASPVATTASGSIVSGIAFTAGPGGTPTAYLASYEPGTTGIQPFTPTYSGPELETLGAGTITTANSIIEGTEFSAAADGAGNIWLGDTNSHSVIQFTPNATPANDTAYSLQPCLGGSTTCASAFATGKPFTVSVDSTGSIWVTAEAAGSLVQIIGAAAPTWPLLSLGKTGKP